MVTDLRIAEKEWKELRKLFCSSFRSGQPIEIGAIGLVGECKSIKIHEFIIAKILLPKTGDFKIANSGALIFDASYIRRAHLEMRSDGLAGLVMFHTHPFADRSVDFSPFDIREDHLLVKNLQEMAPGTRLISVVAGQNSLRGCIWNSPSSRKKLRELIVIGDRISFLPLNGIPEPLPPPPEAIFDRGLIITDAGALYRLSKMTVAIVGASGTGSLMSELLVRAGCKHLMIVDYDIVKDINLNRILHATLRDVREKTPKVMVLKRAIKRIGLQCRVEGVFGNILDRKVIARLKEADVIFGCVDKALPRKYLSEFAYRYYRPYIDVGSEIGGDNKGIFSVDARTSYVAPGRYCLLCSGVVKPRRLHFESLSVEERRRTIAMGYSDDFLIDQPAVMDLNMRSASYGMIMLRHILQPFLLEPIPVHISENILTYTIRPIPDARDATDYCRICRINPKAGYADNGPSIGMEKATVEALRDE
jgi:hypothetical protein